MFFSESVAKSGAFMDVGNTTPVTPERLKEIHDLFLTVGPLPDEAGFDLTYLGTIIDRFEQAERLTSEVWPTASGVFGQLKTEAERLLLDDVDDPEATRKYILKSIEMLKVLGDAANPQAVLTDISKVFVPKNDIGLAVSKKKQNFENPPMGQLNLSSNDDVVVYKEFVGESNEHLEKIETLVLDLENHQATSETIDHIFRCFHSIKGAAGFLGLSCLNRLCHVCETMLDRVRKHTLIPDSDVVETLLASIDACRRMLVIVADAIEKSFSGDLENINISKILQGVDLILQRPLVTVEAMPEKGRLGGLLIEQGIISDEQLSRAIQQQNRPIGNILVDMGAATEKQVTQALEEQSRSQTRAESIKVDTSRLDNLLAMVGELVIAQTQVSCDPAIKGLQSPATQKNINSVDKIIANLQELVMALRLVPLRTIFTKMTRLVRDTTHKTGKEANLVISGEETEIDKTLIEKIADPLVHLLRNAVDHGVEEPEERQKSGKPREGRINLKAYHAGGNVVIEVSDDGNGINSEKVYAKAQERGLISDNREMSDSEIFDFIFHPGLSTNDVATDISGRGVGMDVVRRNINLLGGRIDVSSKRGEGTTFYIRLPLTMAIVDGMIVRVGQERYVLPTLSIEEAFKPTREQICKVSGGKGRAVNIRGKMIPIFSIHSLFELEHNCEPWEGMVVVIKDDQNYCGLVIDEMLDQQQVVIKNLGKKFNGLSGISGGCILGDGRVGLILDASGIIGLTKSV